MSLFFYRFYQFCSNVVLAMVPSVPLASSSWLLDNHPGDLPSVGVGRQSRPLPVARVRAHCRETESMELCWCILKLLLLWRQGWWWHALLSSRTSCDLWTGGCHRTSGSFAVESQGQVEEAHPLVGRKVPGWRGLRQSGCVLAGKEGLSHCLQLTFHLKEL